MSVLRLPDAPAFRYLPVTSADLRYWSPCLPHQCPLELGYWMWVLQTVYTQPTFNRGENEVQRGSQGRPAVDDNMIKLRSKSGLRMHESVCACVCDVCRGENLISI